MPQLNSLVATDTLSKLSQMNKSSLETSLKLTLISCDARLWTQMDKQSGKTKELITNLVPSCRHKANKRLALAKKTK